MNMLQVQLPINGDHLLLTMKEGAVSLKQPGLLENFLATKPYENAWQLAGKIREAYELHFSKPLRVTQDSIAVEILGHIYFDGLAEKIGNAIPLKIADRIREQVRLHCNEINIGEKGHDSNRAFWDMVTPLAKSYFR